MKEIASSQSLPKTATGIRGLDEITGGGLPTGRPSLICGGAGCGKTLFGIEFLARGAMQYDEPGVLLAFEETANELIVNARSLGFDLDDLVAQGKLAIDFVRIERNEIEENGEYDLEGLFVRLGYAIDTIGAKRVVLDTIESLFSGLTNTAIIRAELRRLFRWLKDKGVTAVITGEQGDGMLTRQGLEEYVSDCVILLDHRVIKQISTRRLRVVKYRGTTHGTNEYPFLIDADGISVMPLTSLGLQHEVSTERVSSGISRLDEMLGGKGFYRGSSVLVSGTAGSGKTSLAAHFADAACRRGERVLHFAFEESPGQIIRNIRSLGIDLAPWVDKGLLRFQASRATMHGLEMHLVTFLKLIDQFNPANVIVDPISSMLHGGNRRDANSMVTRLIDFLKVRGITAFLTNLTAGDAALEKTSLDISSLIDSWLLLRDVELGGERNRVMYILKSRGMAHSNQLSEFILSDRGIQLHDAYLGPEGVLTGSMRLAQETREQAKALLLKQESERRILELARQRAALETHISSLRQEFEAEERAAREAIAEAEARDSLMLDLRSQMAASRHSNSSK